MKLAGLLILIGRNNSTLLYHYTVCLFSFLETEFRGKKDKKFQGIFFFHGIIKILRFRQIHLIGHFFKYFILRLSQSKITFIYVCAVIFLFLPFFSMKNKNKLERRANDEQKKRAKFEEKKKD